MRYIKFIILSVIGAIVLFGCTGKTEQAKAKYVFYFIGDGMAANAVPAAAEQVTAFVAE